MVTRLNLGSVINIPHSMINNGNNTKCRNDTKIKKCFEPFDEMIDSFRKDPKNKRKLSNPDNKGIIAKNHLA